MNTHQSLTKFYLYSEFIFLNCSRACNGLIIMEKKPKPLLRGHFHQAMFFIALGAFIPLFVKAQTSKEKLFVGIYAICALTMFGISSLYHRVTWTPKQRATWKKFDHAGIYLMIAGTFTPVAGIGLSPENAKEILITIWIVAFVGILQSIFFVNIPKMVSAIIYIITGFLIIPYFSELTTNIGASNSWTLLAGGIVYSIGALMYGLKRPVLNPKYFSYHEVFHLCVNAGAVLHFIVVSRILA